MAWNDDLDPATPAFAIAQSAHARIRILAGPGTGKSFAMKRRVARLIEVDHVDAGRLLAVTFTRVAAENLHRELVSLAIPGAENLEGRTLHSRDLELTTALHTYDKPGRYTVAVKVIDIFGNDTMTLVPVNVG